MNKNQVIQILEEIAVLLELKGENPFKTRAYSNGARALKATQDELDDLIASGEIATIKGVGKALVEKITTLVKTDQLEFYEKLKAEFPETLLEVLRIPGLGAKKVKFLYEELKITSVPELETACKRGRIAVLPGFGGKTQEKILEGIAYLKKHQGRFHIDRAMEAGHAMLQLLRDDNRIIRAELAGSLRRAKETVKDVDIVGSCAEQDREAIMEAFTHADFVESIIAQGNTKSSIRHENGIQVDLRLVSDAQFPFTLHHFTGSKEHNTAMRSEAKKRGLKMNEYGLFRENDALVSCKNETEIFSIFEMDFIPPELREDQDELQAAREHTLPNLLKKQDLRGILHNHSTYSDGMHSVKEMAEACRNMGMEYFGIADHSKIAVYANGLSAERLEKQAEEIAELNKTYSDFRIFHGTECDILSDGTLDFPDEVLAKLDYVVISVHSKLQMDEREATDRIITAMKNPYATILAHPTGRLLLGREGYPLNYKEIFKVAAEQNVVIEINANPRRLDLDWRFVKQAKEAGVMLSINPDAHNTAGLENMFWGVGIARKGWLTKADVLNAKSLREISVYFENRKQQKQTGMK